MSIKGESDGGPSPSISSPSPLVDTSMEGVRKIIYVLQRENAKMRMTLETIMEGEQHPAVLAFLTLKEMDEDAEDD